MKLDNGQQGAAPDHTQPKPNGSVELPPDVAEETSVPSDTAPAPSDDGSRSDDEQGADLPPDDQDMAELTVTILSKFRPRVPLREIKEKLANKQATMKVMLSVTAVSADDAIMGEGAADQIIECQWSAATTQQHDALPANKDKPPQESRLLTTMRGISDGQPASQAAD